MAVQMSSLVMGALGQLRVLVSFFTERLDLVIDGTSIERPVTPWSNS